MVNVIQLDSICCAVDLIRNFNVIVDETFITKQKRIDLIKSITLIKGKQNFICVYCSSKEDNLERRMKEDRGYSKDKWNEVIENMKRSFEEPTLDEGFDEIIEVKIKQTKEVDNE